jgi:membrane protease YdiL (CAAX protease family)
MENQASLSPAGETAQTLAAKVNWRQVGVYVGMTFGLTWLLDLALFLSGGLKSPAAIIVLQFQMLLPAFSAMLLGMFFFKDSPINLKNNHTRSRWFTWYFLVFTLLYLAGTGVAFVRPDLTPYISSVMLLPGLIGLILAIVLRVKGGKDTFAAVGMGGGKPVMWLLFGLGIIALSGLQTGLSWLFNMGKTVDLAPLLAQPGMPAGMTPALLLVILVVQMLVTGPFLGLLITFGEEYGWRGYLQPALSGLGRVRGVALVGLIWGAWHWPVIWMGYNYPGHPYLGSLMMVLFSSGLAFILGYAVLKAKGVWIAAFLHAMVYQSLSFFMGFIYAPGDPLYAFGLGLPGIVVLALLVALILRDPVWKENE